MEIMHIEARYKQIFELDHNILGILPKKIILFTTIQYFNSIEKIKSQLEEKEIEVKLLQPRRTCHKGQILGCSTEKIQQEGDILYFGDGLFHPKALLIYNNKKIYTYNPKTKESKILTKDNVQPILKKIKGSYIKFLSSDKIGVLLTTKFGQRKEFLIQNLEEKYPNKKFYYFYDNTYEFNSLANFNFVQMFLNTMCERIGYDDSDVQNISILNIEDLKQFESLD